MPFYISFIFYKLIRCKISSLRAMYQFSRMPLHLQVNRFMKLDVLAIGVHPDDVELGCAGALIGEIKNGKKAGILDLTQGELGTRGTIASRYAEAARAAEI